MITQVGDSMVVGGIFREENATFSDGMTLKCLKDEDYSSFVEEE
jgi:hypothetical protein